MLKIEGKINFQGVKEFEDGKTANLNNNDIWFLFFCNKNQGGNITKLAKEVGIAPKNISVRLRKLEDLELIKVKKGKGREKIIILKEDAKEFFDSLKK